MVIDLDDTLISDIGATKQAIAVTLTGCGVPCSEERVDWILTIARAQWRALGLSARQELRGVSSWEALWLDPEAARLTRNVANKLQLYVRRVWHDAVNVLCIPACDPLAVSGAFATKRRQLIAPLPGVVPTLEQLAQEHTLWLATEGAASHQLEKLRSAGLVHWFAGRFISGEIGFSKSHPGFASVIAQELDRLSLEVCAVIGNSIESDIRMASIGGWPAIHICGSNEVKFGYRQQDWKSVRHCKSFSEVIGMCTCHRGRG